MATTTRKTRGQVRDQVSERFGDVVEQVRTPLLATLGAGDLATQAVADLLNKARAQVDRSNKAETPVDVSELRRHLDTAELDKLVDPQELRKLVDPGELRDLVDAYSKAANDLYRYLAEHGESTLDKLRENPQVSRALDQLEDAIGQAQDRFGDAAGDARDLAEEMLTRVNLRERSEQAAKVVEGVATETSQTVAKAGEKVAESARKAGDTSGSPASAAKTSSAKTPAAKTPVTKASTGNASSASKTDASKTETSKSATSKAETSKETAATEGSKGQSANGATPRATSTTRKNTQSKN